MRSIFQIVVDEEEGKSDDDFLPHHREPRLAGLKKVDGQRRRCQHPPTCLCG